jgi:adenylate kinase
LAAETGVCQVSTGDILREAVAAGTDMGLKAKACMDAGELVPDEVVIGIVRDKVAAPECASGFILDGFPRTTGQAEALDDILQGFSAPLDRVAAFTVDEAALVERLSGRRTCKGCQATFHVSFAPPQRDGVCDRCGGELVQRGDDRPEAIGKRLLEYAAKTRPLTEYYRDRGLLAEVAAGGDMDEVYTALKRVVGA